MDKKMTPTPAMVEAALDAQYEGDGWRSHEVAERRDMSAALTAALAVSGYGEVVEALAGLLSHLGPDGYIPSCGEPATRRAQAALARAKSEGLS